MNLNKRPHPQPLPKLGRGGRHDVPESIGSFFPPFGGTEGGSSKTITMKKLIRFFGIIALVGVLLALFSFGNAIVQDYAMIDLERTINYIESSLLGLLCVAFISLTVMFWRDEL